MPTRLEPVLPTCAGKVQYQHGAPSKFSGARNRNKIDRSGVILLMITLESYLLCWFVVNMMFMVLFGNTFQALSRYLNQKFPDSQSLYHHI